jgi:hypothetical protein
MRAINHALTGAVIGLTITEPIVAVPVAFVSHYVLDIIPHHGSNLTGVSLLNSLWFRWLLVVDAFLCVLLVFVLAIARPKHWLLAAICAFVAAAPDLASIRRYRLARRHETFQLNWYERIAKDIQWFERPIGAIVEVIWAIAMIVILLTITRKG